MTEVDLTLWRNQMNAKIGELDSGGSDAQKALADELREVVQRLEAACESSPTLSGSMRGDVE